MVSLESILTSNSILSLFIHSYDKKDLETIKFIRDNQSFDFPLQQNKDGFYVAEIRAKDILPLKGSSFSIFVTDQGGILTPLQYAVHHNWQRKILHRELAVLIKRTSNENLQTKITFEVLNARKRTNLYKTNMIDFMLEDYTLTINGVSNILDIDAALDQRKFFIALHRVPSKDKILFPIESISEDGFWSAHLDLSSIGLHNLYEGIWQMHFYEEIEGKLLGSFIKDKQKLITTDSFKTTDQLFKCDFKKKNSGLILDVRQESLLVSFKESYIQNQTLIAKISIASEQLALIDHHVSEIHMINNQNTENTISTKLKRINDEDFILKIPFKHIIESLQEGSQKQSDWLFLITNKKSQKTFFAKVTNTTLIFDENNVLHVFEKVPFEVGLHRTSSQNLSFTVRKARTVRNLYQVKKIRGHYLKIEGAAILRGLEMPSSESVKRSLVLKERASLKEIIIPVQNKRDLTFAYHYKRDKKDYTYCGFKVMFDTSTLPEEKGVWDFFVRFDTDQFSFDRRLGFVKYTYKKDKYLSIIKYQGNDDNKIFNFSSTTPKGNLKLEVLPFKSAISEDQISESREEVWIIGERPDTAQDTGYHFFKYCREKHPDKKVYYAIEEGSKDIRNIEHLGNVLIIGSTEHIEKTLQATHFIGSHDLEYFLPFKIPQYQHTKKAKRIFLQHGVMGRKSAEYHRFFYQYPFHIVCVSSVYEKKMMMDHFGYKESEVKVTGLSRFDHLANTKTIDDHRDREILIMPTWREWLNTEETFLKSDYYEKYISILKDEKLLKELRKHRVKLLFYPHYRMQPYISYFNKYKSDVVSILELGEVNVQELLMRASLLITDYSSVSFDVSFMKKPVIYYHFDFDEFFNKGILRSKEETFLGKIVEDQPTLVSEIIQTMNNHFREKLFVEERRDLILTYTDNKNCERIFNEISSLKDDDVSVIDSITRISKETLQNIKIATIQTLVRNYIFTISVKKVKSLKSKARKTLKPLKTFKRHLKRNLHKKNYSN
ncbi:CDP-glycerol glycerophosphotransferase family protein [Bacillus pumilus]|uniref:CDP-glycerol glycerophosphotransferase family protein n=1 Tax=Bacillus pumilus TaxID=1408 RepID=UPI00119F125D|nr:CDP-glycerol glycerophosphotransferase family protein [Bacillus pumilus]